MDVVPADASRWAKDPFGGEIADGKIWGRGAMDMKGPGVAHLYAFIMLKRQNVPLDRDILLMAVPDEEVGGGLGATWMREKHYQELDPSISSTKAASAAAISSRPASWSSASRWRRKTDLAEAHRRRRRRPRLAAARQDPNDRLVRALARLLGEPMPTAQFSVLDTLKARVGALADNKFNNAIQRSTISITTLRAGSGIHRKPTSSHQSPKPVSIVACCQGRRRSSG